jgi:hypothetical protein
LNFKFLSQRRHSIQIQEIRRKAKHGCPAGRPRNRRIRTGLRSDRLVWHLRADGHAGRDHRQVERRNHRRRRRSRFEGAPSRLRP